MGHAVDNPAVITMACARPCDSSVQGLKQPGQIIAYSGRLVSCRAS